MWDGHDTAASLATDRQLHAMLQVMVVLVVLLQLCLLTKLSANKICLLTLAARVQAAEYWAY